MPLFTERIGASYFEPFSSLDFCTACWLPIANDFPEFFVHAVLSLDSSSPENPLRQEAGKSPNERVEEAKARVARLEGALQLLGVVRSGQSSVVFSLLGNVSILA